MLVSKNAKICLNPDAKPEICVTPNAKPKRKSVVNRLRLVEKRKFLALVMYISYFLCRFHLHRVVHFQWNMGFSQRIEILFVKKESVLILFSSRAFRDIAQPGIQSPIKLKNRQR